MIAPDPVSGVVVQERFGEAHYRVCQRGRIGGRLVRAGLDLRLDHVGDELNRSGLDDAGARGEQAHSAVSFLLEEPADRRRPHERAVDAVKDGQQSGSTATAHLAPFVVDELLELIRDHFAEQRLSRAEPAVDRGPAQSKLARDDGEVDAFTVEVLPSDHAQHVSARGCCGASSLVSRCHDRNETLVFETSEDGCI
jgi:hypothetical protein